MQGPGVEAISGGSETKASDKALETVSRRVAPGHQRPKDIVRPAMRPVAQAAVAAQGGVLEPVETTVRAP